jgi:hypothetical protein
MSEHGEGGGIQYCEKCIFSLYALKSKSNKEALSSSGSAKGELSLLLYSIVGRLSGLFFSISLMN